MAFTLQYSCLSAGMEEYDRLIHGNYIKLVSATRRLPLLPIVFGVLNTSNSIVYFQVLAAQSCPGCWPDYGIITMGSSVAQVLRALLGGAMPLPSRDLRDENLTSPHWQAGFTTTKHCCRKPKFCEAIC